MPDERLEKFRRAILEQEGGEEKAGRLAEIDAQFEPYLRNMFIEVGVNRTYNACQNWCGVVEDSGYSGGYHRTGSSATTVTTGVFRGIGYQENTATREIPENEQETPDGEVKINSEDLQEWKELLLYNGPYRKEEVGSLPLDSRIIRAKDEKDGIMLWNGHLPIDIPPEGKSSISSRAIVFGNEAVTRLFGLKTAEGIASTEDLYRAMLAQQGATPEEIVGICQGQALCELEAIVRMIPFTFFEKDIFAKYGVEKPSQDSLNRWKMFLEGFD